MHITCKIHHFNTDLKLCFPEKHQYTVFIRIKARLKYTQGLKYMPGGAAE